MRIPKLCHHKAQALGYVTVAGKEVYFKGIPWPRDMKNPPGRVVAAYEQWRAEFVAGMLEPRPEKLRDPSLAEIWLAYHRHAVHYYRKNGKATSEIHCLKSACSLAVRLYGEEPAVGFDVLKLRRVRDEFVARGLSRKTANGYTDRVRRMFRWAASEKLVPASLVVELGMLPALRRGKTTAPDHPPILPVPLEDVEATLPFLHSPVRELVQVHYLLGCRSQDARRLRPSDLTFGDGCWEYLPKAYKTEGQDQEEGRPLIYYVGERAQRIIEPFLEKCAPSAYLFCPRLAKKAHVRGRDHYTHNSYRVAVQRACQRAGVPAWSPLQLRHSRLTFIRAQYRAEAAQTVAGHRNLKTTEIYSERNNDLARKIMEEIG